MFRRNPQRYGATPVPTTPYDRAGQVWDDRLGSARAQAKNWRVMAFGSLGLSLSLAAGIVWLSGQSRVVPYVVEVDKQGGVQAIGPAIRRYDPQDAQIAHFLSEFIRKVRSFSTDGVVDRDNWLNAYQFFLTDHGKLAFNAYARDHDPSKMLGHQATEVDVTSLVRVSATSFEVKWTERHVDQEGVKTERWTAILTYAIKPPSNQAQINANPLGVYVDGINWSQDFHSGEAQ
jgi:type IV secretion system protein VirB5